MTQYPDGYKMFEIPFEKIIMLINPICVWKKGTWDKVGIKKEMSELRERRFVW